MNLRMLLQYGLLFPFLASSTLLANATSSPLPPAKDLIIKSDQKVYDPNVLSIDSIRLYEERYSYNWNDYGTIQVNKKKAADIENFIQKNPNIKKLNPADQHAFGKLLYKLATYYTHIAREPELAIVNLNKALPFLQSKEEKAWNYNHLAYAYELKYAVKHDDADRTKGIAYTQKVIKELYPHTKNKVVAFAYAVEGILENDAKNYGYAENYLRNAIQIYESLSDGKDDQYARTKSRLARTLLERNDKDNEAISILQELQKYWEAKKDANHNPYAARNLILLGEAYLKTNKEKEAVSALQQGIEIIQATYGTRSLELSTPYELLAAAYIKKGDIKLSNNYQNKIKNLTLKAG